VSQHWENVKVNLDLFRLLVWETGVFGLFLKISLTLRIIKAQWVFKHKDIRSIKLLYNLLHLIVKQLRLGFHLNYLSYGAVFLHTDGIF